MRVLKFRAWKVDERRMVTLDPDDSYPDDNWSSSDLIEDHNWKVMQFTNLHDRNGKEIYEGDILKREIFYNVDRRITVVTYQKGCICLITPGDEPTDGRILCKTDELFTGKVEVIGNIYENPVLLTQ